MGGYRRFVLFWLGAALVAFAWMVLAAALLAPAHAGEAPGTATLVIHVGSISPRGGMVRLGLYDEAGYPSDESQPVASADVAAVQGETVITLHDVPPGTYAVEAFQDLNSNGKMDSNWLGIPLEPYGFSRDAHPILSKPAFERVKFAVVPGLNTQSLHLQNSESFVASK